MVVTDRQLAIVLVVTGWLIVVGIAVVIALLV